MVIRETDSIHSGFQSGSVKYEPCGMLIVWASWNEVKYEPFGMLIVWAIWNAYSMSQMEWSPWANEIIISKMSQFETSRRSISAFYLMPVSQIPLTCLNFARFGSHLSQFSREIGPVWFSWKCKFCPYFPDLWFTTLEMFVYENWKLQLLKGKKISKRH